MSQSDRLTRISAEDMDAVVRLRRNSAFARQYLESGIHTRSFPETLLQYSGLSDMVELRLGLFRLQDLEGEASGDSLRRKIDNWLKGKTTANSREQLIRICFALRMDLENAQNFIATVGEGGLHYRNPVELTWLYGLRNGLDYNRVLNLQRMIACVRIGGEGTTANIMEEFNNVRTVDEFVLFVSRKARSLGTLHNTAYRHFRRLLAILTGPENSPNGVVEETYTVRDVVRMYLSMPGQKENGGGSGVLPSILKRHWPDEVLISRILTRQIDVPRKVLTLLFLVTDGADDNASDSDDPAELFADRYRRLNLLLDECGFCQLDPRNTFDWLALYCMYCDEDTEASERMRQVLAENMDRARRD